MAISKDSFIQKDVKFIRYDSDKLQFIHAAHVTIVFFQLPKESAPPTEQMEMVVEPEIEVAEEEQEITTERVPSAKSFHADEVEIIPLPEPTTTIEQDVEELMMDEEPNMTLTQVMEEEIYEPVVEEVLEQAPQVQISEVIPDPDEVNVLEKTPTPIPTPIPTPTPMEQVRNLSTSNIHLFGFTTAPSAKLFSQILGKFSYFSKT